MGINKTAMVSDKAKIDASVEIGPNVVVEPDVEIHPGVKIMANAYICSGTEIGENTEVHVGAVIGNEPQDYAYEGQKTFTKIGMNCVIREYVTIHRGTKEGSSTVVGNGVMLMASSHLGHNCRLEDKVIVANSALLAGYVEVGEGAFISGNVVFHQFCRVGKQAMIGGFTGVNKDVPPFMNVRGPSVVRGVNLVGLRRSGMPRESIGEIKQAYNLLYLSGISQKEAVGEMKKTLKSDEANTIISFIETSKRGICKHKYEKEEYFD